MTDNAVTGLVFTLLSLLSSGYRLLLELLIVFRRQRRRDNHVLTFSTLSCPTSGLSFNISNNPRSPIYKKASSGREGGSCGQSQLRCMSHTNSMFYGSRDIKIVNLMVNLGN